jgi:tetratricopeptide (TPR) repeat protein
MTHGSLPETCYFRQQNMKDAAEWFGKAIEVDPNRETAYRYWGDALVAAGDPDAALPKFIDAVVAEPYSRKAWQGLSQWAQHKGTRMEPPHISVPPAPTLQENGTEKPGDTINAADDGISRDYAAYRNAHRDIVHAYIEQQILHRKTAKH